MTDLLAQATATLGPALPLLVLIHLRLLGCVVTLPGFGERSVPVRLRVVLAMALTPVFAALPAPPLPDDPGALLAAAGSEMVVGLILGMTVRLTAATLSIAATTIAATGSLAQLIGGESEMAPHPIGNLLHLGGLALLMAMGFPMMLADYLGASFSAWPLATVPDPAVLAPAFIGLVARGFALAMVLASPFVLGGFLYQALGGVIGKVMPALPVVFVGAPLAILLALIGLTLFASPLLGVWVDAVLSTTLPGATP